MGMFRVETGKNIINIECTCFKKEVIIGLHLAFGVKQTFLAEKQEKDVDTNVM
jgi:hypothetical protein